MKKLKLSLANMQGAEMLTREQLKKVVGGLQGSFEGPCPAGEFPCNAKSDHCTIGKCVSSIQECWEAC